MSADVNIAIIGAGVVGLAIAAELSQHEQDIFVLEKNQTFGLETSSRNSEVIHAGLYYPEGSLKARFCVEGNRLLYDFCEKYNVEHRRLGKIIVATSDEEVAKLEELIELGKNSGVTGLRLISRDEVNQLEPNIKAVAGLLSPETGILDAYSLMRALNGLARERGAHFVYSTEVTGITQANFGYEIEIIDREGISPVHADIIINSAGLNSDRIAGMTGINISKAGYRLHYCKGEYFSLTSPDGAPVSRLVYPLPEHAGKGIHVTPAMDGRMRLGPNTRYVDEVDYTVDDTDKEAFYESVRKFLPCIRLEDITPEMAGVRPKLQGPDDGFRDYIITHEEDRGLPGLINLVGIESPGLTASLAIGRYVAGMVRGMKG